MKKPFLVVFLMLVITVILIYIIKKEKGAFDNNIVGEANKDFIEVVYLDVGQGDATFIEWPDGTQMLVDCAKDARVLEALGRVMDFYDKSIDYLLVTHPDLDHFGGCSDVLSRFEVKNIISTGVNKDIKSWQSFLESSSEEKAGHVLITKKQDLVIGSSTIKFLYPDEDVSHQDIEPNNTSIVFVLSFGQSDLLFTGDAEKELEQYLVDSFKDEIGVEVLKVSHHGSAGSSIQSFVDFVSPEISVVSAGRGNSYGHPSLRILKRLERVGSKIYRTDLQGDLRFSVFPEKIIAIE